jgi:hypothetical protein
MMSLNIWQYWETKGFKPLFVDDLMHIAEQRSGVPIVRVGPDDFGDYMTVPDRLMDVAELAHKADIIRSGLLAQNGGIWIDSDAIILKPLQFMLDDLGDFDFVGFSDTCDLSDPNDPVRINLFACRPDSVVVKEWHRRQVELLKTQTTFEWTAMGDLLNDSIRAVDAPVKLYPFDKIAPISSRDIKQFSMRSAPDQELLEETIAVMLSNKAMERRRMNLRKMPIQQIAEQDLLISHFVRKALDPDYQVPNRTETRKHKLRNVLGRFFS